MGRGNELTTGDGAPPAEGPLRWSYLAAGWTFPTLGLVAVALPALLWIHAIGLLGFGLYRLVIRR